MRRPGAVARVLQAETQSCAGCCCRVLLQAAVAGCCRDSELWRVLLQGAVAARGGGGGGAAGCNFRPSARAQLLLPLGRLSFRFVGFLECAVRLCTGSLLSVNSMPQGFGAVHLVLAFLQPLFRCAPIGLVRNCLG